HTRLIHLLYSLLPHPPPSSTLFPYSTLFRSLCRNRAAARIAPGSPDRQPRQGRNRPPSAKRGGGVERGTARTEPATSTRAVPRSDRKSTRLNSSHDQISYAVFCLKKKKLEKM